MSTQRYVSTSFWDDRWIRSLTPDGRYLYLYLMTNPRTNIAGVYEITIDRIAFDTGIDERTLRTMLDDFSKANKAVFYHDEWMILPRWPKHQRVSEKDNVRKGIDRILCEIPRDVYDYLAEIDYDYKYLSKAPRDDVSTYTTTYYEAPCKPLASPLKTLARPLNYSDSDSDSDLDSNAKRTYGPNNGVLLTDSEYQKLVDRFGELNVEKLLTSFEDYTTRTGKTYKNHYRTLLNWGDRDKMEPPPPENKIVEFKPEPWQVEMRKKLYGA